MIENDIPFVDICILVRIVPDNFYLACCVSVVCLYCSKTTLLGINTTPKKIQSKADNAEAFDYLTEEEENNSSDRVTSKQTQRAEGCEDNARFLSNHYVLPTADHKFHPTGATDWYGQNKPYIHAFSAYYDDRKLLFNSSSIVILGLTTIKHEGGFRCRFLYNNSTYFDSEPKVHIFSGIPFRKADGAGVKDFIFWCPLRFGTPSNVSVIQVPRGKTLLTLPVSIPQKPKRIIPLSICVKNLYIPLEENYEPISAFRFTEWIEMNRLLGVEHFTIYVHSLPETVHDVFYYYYKLGIIDVISQGPINGDHFIQPRALSVNDCLYRNMYRYHKIINIDTDEVIVPTNYSNLTEFLARIDQENTIPVGDMIFPSRAFYTEAIPEHPSGLIFPFASTYVQDKITKNILDINRCLKVTSHYCIYVIPGNKVLSVDDKYGSNYHFKRCSTARLAKRPKDCDDAIASGKTDNRMRSFHPQLESRVKKATVGIQELKMKMKIGNRRFGKKG